MDVNMIASSSTSCRTSRSTHVLASGRRTAAPPAKMRRASLLTALVAGHVGFLLHQDSLTVVEAAAPMQVDQETSSAPRPKTKTLALPRNFVGSKRRKPVVVPWPCENFGDVEFLPAEFENERLAERCFYQGEVEEKREPRQSGEGSAGDAPLKIVEIKKRKGRGKFYQLVPGTNEAGATYEGNFEDNKFHGAGALTLATGRVIRANWVAGALRNSDPKTRCSSDYGELELEDPHWTRLHELSERFNRKLQGVVNDERLVGGWNKLQIKGAIVHRFSGGRLCEAFLKDRHMESGHPNVARIVDREEDDAQEMKKWLSSTEAEVSSARGSADHGVGADLRAGVPVDEGDSRAPASIVADHYDYVEFDSLPQLGTAFVDVGRRTLHRLNLFVDTSPAPASAPPGGRAAAAKAGEELPQGGALEEEDEDEDFSASSPPPVGTLTTSFRFTPIERGFGSSDRTYVAENREIVVEQIVSRFWSGPFLVDCEAAARRALGLDEEADSGAGPPTVADFYIAKVTSLGDAEDRIRSAASPSISGGDSTWLEGRPVSIMQEPVERYSVYTGPLNSRLLADTATKMARHCVRSHGHGAETTGLLDKRRFGDEFFMMGGEKSPDGKPFLAATQEDWAALPNEFQVGGEPQIAVDANTLNETIAQVLGRFDLQLALPRPNPSTKFEPLTGCRLPSKKWTLLDWNKFITAPNQRRPDLAIRAKLSSSRYEGGGGRDDKILRVMKQVVHYEGEWRAGYRHGLIRLNVVYVIPKSEAEVGAARTGESKDAKVVVGTGGRMQWGAVDNYDVWTQFLANINVERSEEDHGAATDVEPASNTARTAAAKLLDERIARAIREGKAGAEVSIRLADALRYPRLFAEAVDRAPKSVKEQLDKSAQQYEDFERLLEYDSLSEEERVRSGAKEVEEGEERWKRMLAWYNCAQLWPSVAARVHMLPHLRIELPGFVRRAQGWWKRNDLRIGQRDEDPGTQTRGTVEEVVEVEVEDDQMGKKKAKREVKRRNHLVLGSYLLLHVNWGDFIKAKERVYGGSGAGGYSVYPNDQMLFLKGRLLVEQDRLRAIGGQTPVAVESLRWPVYNFLHRTQREGPSGKMFPMEHEESPLVAHGMGDLAETQRQQQEWKATRDTLWRKNFKRGAAVFRAGQSQEAVFRAGQMDDKTHLYLVSDRFYARPVVDDAPGDDALQGRGPLQLRKVGDALSIEDARALEAEFMEHHDQGPTGTCYAYAVANLLQMYRMLYHRFGVVRQWPRNPDAVSWEADFQRLESRRLATMLQSSEVKGVVKAPHLWQTPGRGHQFPSLEAEVAADERRAGGRRDSNDLGTGSQSRSSSAPPATPPRAASKWTPNLIVHPSQLPPVNYNEPSWIPAPWDFQAQHTQLQQHPPQPLHPVWPGFYAQPVWDAAGGVHGVYGGENLGLHVAPQRRVTPTPMPEAVTRHALIDGGYIEEALLRAVGGAVALRTEQEVITWLETKGPVAAHYRVKPQAAAPTQGQLPYPSRPAVVEHGFHALVVIGYKRTEVGKPVSWVLKNSWDHMRIIATDDPKFLDTFYTGPPEKSDTDQVVSSSSAGEEDARAHAALLREKKELESSYEPAFWAPRYLPPQQYSNTEQHEETLARRFDAQDWQDRQLLESPVPFHLRMDAPRPTPASPTYYRRPTTATPMMTLTDTDAAANTDTWRRGGGNGAGEVLVESPGQSTSSEGQEGEGDAARRGAQAPAVGSSTRYRTPPPKRTSTLWGARPQNGPAPGGEGAGPAPVIHRI